MREQQGKKVATAKNDRKLEMDWRQQTRQLWLQEGDAQTKFFHLVANGTRREDHFLRARCRWGMKSMLDHRMSIKL